MSERLMAAPFEEVTGNFCSAHCGWSGFEIRIFLQITTGNSCSRKEFVPVACNVLKIWL